MKKTLKLLSQKDFIMPLIQDLGIIDNRRKAIFCCNNCKCDFTTNVTTAKNSKTGVCKKCLNKVRPTTKTLIQLPISIHGINVVRCIGIDRNLGKRLAVFECPYCKVEFTAAVANVVSKNTTKCHKCGLVHGPRPGFKSELPSVFYILKFKDSEKIKIGITNKSVESRYQKRERILFTVLTTVKFYNGIDAFMYEQYLLSKYTTLRFKEKKKLLLSGNKEILEKNIFTSKIEGTIHDSISSWGKCTGLYIECAL
jgi:hypothetical protein